MASSPSAGQTRRRYRRRWSWWSLLIFFLLVIAAVRRGCETFSPQRADAPPTIAEGMVHVVRVVDGDTIIVQPLGESSHFEDAPQARVRLLGIDAPESVKPNHPVEPFGPEAAEFAREFLSGGRAELRLDRRRKDQYERFLAYVYVEDQMLNEALARAGLARASHYPGDSPQIARRLQDAEQEAQRAGVGIWSLVDSRSGEE